MLGRASAAVSQPTRTIGALGVAVLCFSAVAGGPFGIEPAVGNAGARPTLLSLVLVSLAWACTQALMVAELSTMMPSNAGYIVLVWSGKSLAVFAGVVVVESLCNGLVSAAFVAYFMTLCEPRFAAAQYAVLSGLMYLAGALVGATSGYLVEHFGYEGFFWISIVVGIPPLLALPWAMPANASNGVSAKAIN